MVVHGGLVEGDERTLDASTTCRSARPPPPAPPPRWLNETTKHTRLEVRKLHGVYRGRRRMAVWLRTGSVAVTTFGTPGRLPPQARQAETAVVIVDEAHYIKNPETVRSQVVVPRSSTRSVRYS
jgi:hypothetical protein